MNRLKSITILIILIISGASAETKSDYWMVDHHGWYLTGYEHITVSTDFLDGKDIIRQDKTSRRWADNGNINTRTYTAYIDKSYSPIKELQRNETIDPKGKVISYRSIEAVYKGNTVECTIDNNGSITRNTYPIPDGTDLVTYFRLALNDGKLKVGDTVKTSGFSLINYKIEDLTYKIAGQEKIGIDGKLCNTFYADCNIPGSSFRIWIREGGETVKWSTPDGHLWSAIDSMSEALEAFRGNPPDFSSIKVRNPFVQQTHIKSMSVSFDNIQDTEFVKNYKGQECKYNSDNKTARYDIKSEKFDDRNSLELPITDKLYSKWLEHSDNQDITKLAKEIVGNEKNAYKAALKIRQWVYENIRFDAKSTIPEDAVSVLKEKQGLCRHFSALYCDLARAAGIPTRSVAGLIYNKDVYQGHAWNEVYVGKWVPIDSTSPCSCGFVDAAYIKLAEDTIKVKETQCPATIIVNILGYEPDQDKSSYNSVSK